MLASPSGGPPGPLSGMALALEGSPPVVEDAAAAAAAAVAAGVVAAEESPPTPAAVEEDGGAAAAAVAPGEPPLELLCWWWRWEGGEGCCCGCWPGMERVDRGLLSCEETGKCIMRNEQEKVFDCIGHCSVHRFGIQV